jgi:hypothetical protein
MDISKIGVRERSFTPSKFLLEYPLEDYTLCRYGRIGESKYETAPFILVSDKVPKTFNYNEDIIPRKGDKANWLEGTDVEIDVFNVKDYTAVEIYRGDRLIDIKDISSLVVVSDLDAGLYRARLVGEEKCSEFCYWTVVDATSHATPGDNETEVKVEFSASNAKPLFIIWQDSEKSGTKHIQFLSSDEIRAGFAIGQYRSGNYRVRVAFETEYGIIFSELPEGITIP